MSESLDCPECREEFATEGARRKHRVLKHVRGAWESEDTPRHRELDEKARGQDDD